MVTKSPNRGEVYQPCIFNANGADEKMCKRISGISGYAVRCRASNCQSRWKVRTSKPPPKKRKKLKINLQREGALEYQLE